MEAIAGLQDLLDHQIGEALSSLRYTGTLIGDIANTLQRMQDALHPEGHGDDEHDDG